MHKISLIKPFQIGLCLLFSSMHVYSATIEQSLNEESKTNIMGQKNQRSVSKLSNETDELLRQYQRILQKADYQKSFNEELKYQIEEQEQEITLIEQQTEDVQITRLHILPLLREMVSSLKSFIELDLPFERNARLLSVTQLESLLASGAPVSEKFRRVFELYQAESDYSYSVSQYRETLRLNGESLSVDILRIGRLALYYQTLNGDRSGIWDVSKKQWLNLKDSHNKSIREGMRVAAKQLAPQLLVLPTTEEGLAIKEGMAIKEGSAQ